MWGQGVYFIFIFYFFTTIVHQGFYLSRYSCDQPSCKVGRQIYYTIYIDHTDPISPHRISLASTRWNGRRPFWWCCRMTLSCSSAPRERRWTIGLETSSPTQGEGEWSPCPPPPTLAPSTSTKVRHGATRSYGCMQWCVLLGEGQDMSWPFYKVVVFSFGISFWF